MELRFFLSHPQCGRKASHLTKTLLKRRDPFNRIMNAKWILVLFVGLHMALHISNAEVYDELLRQDAEFENRQPQKRRFCQDVNPIRCFLRKYQCDSLAWPSYRAFTTFVSEQCPYTCRIC